jgi:hypothetical protein
MPDDRTYEGKVLRLSEPAGDEGILDSMTFIDCQVKGPAVLVTQASELRDCNLGGPTADAVLWEVDPNIRPVIVGAILAQNCHFERCTFERVGFAGPPELMEEFRKSPGR